MPVGHLSSLEKCLFKSYAHFLSCMRLLIYFGNLSHVGNIVGKYFFPLCRFLFILFMVSFAVPKLPSLIRSHWLIFAFISSVLGDRPKKTLLQFMSENILPIFS